jgi:hypothetical protein
MVETRRRMFISYVHEDESVAVAVQRLLEQVLEVSVFLSSDRTRVYAGDLWLQKITAALTEAEVVLLMLSQRSVRRPWVNFEAGGAWLMGKKVIPCCYGNQAPGAMPHPYSAVQAVHLPRDSYYLVRSVHHQLGLTSAEPISPFLENVEKALSGSRRSFWADLIEPYGLLDRTLADFADEPAVSNP